MTSRRSFVSEDDAIAVYSECIRLSAANKINVKNAFGLRLIDCIDHLTKQKQINFKQIGCALAAGAQIYGHRVDYVQAEAQKVAKDLATVTNNAVDQAGDDLDDDDGKINPDGETLPKRRKIERKKAKTISADISSLNTTKVESNLPPDPLLALLSSFDVGNVNSLLMSNLPLNDDGLLLLSSVVIPPVDSKIIDVTLDGSSIEGLLSSKPLIIPKLSKFEFLNRGEELDNSISTMRAGTQSDKSSFALDGVHSLSQPFESSLDPREAVADDYTSDHHDAGGFFDDHHSIGSNDDHESVRPDNNAQQSMAHYSMRAVDSDGFDKLVDALSKQPSDYTYFNKDLLGMWAGPEYWKLNPQARRGIKHIPNAATTKSARKPKNPFIEIDFKQKLPTPQYVDRRNVLIHHNTVYNWPPRLLPSDISYEPLKLIKSFLLEGTTFSLVRKTGIDPNGGSNFNDDDSDGRSSPGIDAGMDNHYDDEFPPTQECFGTQAYNHDLDSGTYAPFSGDNLVDEPFAVSSTALPFSTHAKKIDVKRLKREMWTIVTSDAVNKSQTSESINTSNDNSEKETTQESEIITNTDEENQEKPLPFTQVYKILPTRVGTSMANNLSVPIAFVALLHLTNEKNLKLQGKPDLSDFFIKTESLIC